jgi:hypothetical protein
MAFDMSAKAIILLSEISFLRKCINFFLKKARENKKGRRRK